MVYPGLQLLYFPDRMQAEGTFVSEVSIYTLKCRFDLLFLLYF